MAKKTFSTNVGDSVRVGLTVQDIFYRCRREQVDIVTALVYAADLLLNGGKIVEVKGAPEGTVYVAQLNGPCKAAFTMAELLAPDKRQSLMDKTVNPDAGFVKVSGVSEKDIRISDAEKAKDVLGGQSTIALLDLGSMVAVMPRTGLAGKDLTVATVPIDNVEKVAADADNGLLILAPDKAAEYEQWLVSEWFGSPDFANEAKALVEFLAVGTFMVNSRDSADGTMAVYNYNGSEYMVPERFLALS